MTENQPSGTVVAIVGQFFSPAIADRPVGFTVRGGSAGSFRSRRCPERDILRDFPAGGGAVVHAVYLRPTRNGLTVMSLDPTTAALIGVGGIASGEDPTDADAVGRPAPLNFTLEDMNGVSVKLESFKQLYERIRARWPERYQSMPLWRALHPERQGPQGVEVPAPYEQSWTREDACREVVRGRLQGSGPSTAAALAGAMP